MTFRDEVTMPLLAPVKEPGNAGTTIWGRCLGLIVLRLKLEHTAGALSGLLRLASLAAKLGLTLYMGRYLSLTDMGLYGLVFSSVMIATTVLGLRFDYVVSRDLVRTTPEAALAKMRDQTIFYLVNYAAAVAVLIPLVAAHLTSLPPRILVYICVLTVTDNYTNLTYVNMNSLEKPLRANALYFIASGLWCFPAIGLGLYSPAFRNVDTILTAWIVGSVAFFLVTFWTWRSLPWRRVRSVPVDWQWLKRGMRTSALIWLGTVGLSAGTYIDRFVVIHFLDLEKVGVATFYASFASAMLTMVHSGILSFAYPRLVALHREDDAAGFKQEMRRVIRNVAISAGIIGIAIGFAVPTMGAMLSRPEFIEYAPVLWLIIGGVWIRSNADTLYQVLFARHQDSAIWLGDLLYIVPALGCNALFVFAFGLVGIGIGSIASNLFIFGWRALSVSRGIGLHRKPRALSEHL